MDFCYHFCSLPSNISSWCCSVSFFIFSLVIEPNLAIEDGKVGGDRDRGAPEGNNNKQEEEDEEEVQHHHPNIQWAS